MDKATKRRHSLWYWAIGVVVIGCTLYLSRAFWPIFFQGEPYAEIEATIPPDMTLRVGASYRSLDCTEITFLDFGQVPGGKGWSKDYAPDSQGKVKVNIYPRVMGPCSWHLTDFGISTIYHEIPANTLAVQGVSDEIKQEIVKQFSDAGDLTNKTVDLDLRVLWGGSSEKYNETDSVTLNSMLTPTIIKGTLTDDTIYYRFSYGPGEISEGESYEVNNLPPYDRKEPLKIRYNVNVDNRVFFEEIYPDIRKNTSRVIE